MNYSELQNKIKEIEKKAEKDIKDLKLQYLKDNELKTGIIFNQNNINYKIIERIKYDLKGYFGICIVYKVEVLKKDLISLKNPKFEKFDYYLNSNSIKIIKE